MKKLFILFFFCTLLGACTNEKEAQELYQKATQQKQIKNYQTAIQIYKQIAEQYPRSSVISSVLNEMAFCEKEFTKQKIEHNAPIILKAVDSFPARKFPATKKGTLPLGKSITSFERTMCNVAKNYNERVDSYEDYVTASLFEESSCNYTLGKWNINSQNNQVYTVSKTRTGQGLLDGKKIQKNYTYIVNIIDNTIAAKDHSSCFILSQLASKLFEKESKKITVDYEKECSFPIKLEGVLK